MTRVLVLGGSGFIGRELVAKLVSDGCQVTVPTRAPQRSRHLLVLPGIRVVQANVHDDADLAALLRDQDAVVNLVAVLQGASGRYDLNGQSWDVGPTFGQAHIGLVDRLVRLAPAGTRVVHVSALGAGDRTAADLPSRYLRSKAAGEALLKASALNWTIVRPSLVFGEHDKLLNTFAGLQAMLPVLALPRAGARYQPIWVDDIARGLAGCITDPRAARTRRQVLDAVGPTTVTMRDLVGLAGRYSGHRRPVIGLPDFAGKLIATAMELAPGPTPMSRDNIASMTLDNVSQRGAPQLMRVFDIVPRDIEEVAPGYLGRRDNVYDRARRHARRW